MLSALSLAPTCGSWTVQTTRSGPEDPRGAAPLVLLLGRSEAQALAASIAAGPTFAHAMTKRQLDAEWHVSIDEAITMEAHAQAICMKTKDFHRAYEAFADKRRPEFQGD